MANTMMALVYRRETGIQLETRPIPSLQHPRDAIVKVIRSTICTSDLHIKNGFVPRAVSDIVLGHEFVGEVVECGREVTNLKPGDRVAANCETFCGECWFCKMGFINNCQVGGWELGCRIDKAYAGNGYGTEAFAAVAEWGLYKIHLSRVVAKCYKENQASYKMLSACMRKKGEDDTFFYFEKLV